MNNYYIKYITGPYGQLSYHKNDDDPIAFASKQEKPCNRFRECDGFFLYETGHNKGARAIYARGVIAANPSCIKIPESGIKEEWPYAVKVILQARINPLNGIPLHKIEKIIEKKLRNQRGGILKITKEQFDILSSELDKSMKKWYERPAGMIIITVVTGLIIAGVVFSLGWN